MRVCRTLLEQFGNRARRGKCELSAGHLAAFEHVLLERQQAAYRVQLRRVGRRNHLGELLVQIVRDGDDLRGLRMMRDDMLEPLQCRARRGVRRRRGDDVVRRGLRVCAAQRGGCRHRDSTDQRNGGKCEQRPRPPGALRTRLGVVVAELLRAGRDHVQIGGGGRENVSRNLRVVGVERPGGG